MGVARNHTALMKETQMKTTETEIRIEPATTLCHILSMPIKHWLIVVTFILFSIALYVVVFAGEAVQCSPSCEAPTSGLAATLNLSQKQREDLQQLADQFGNDTAATRGTIMVKRLELKRLSKDPEANVYTIRKVERELNVLEQEFSRKIHQVEIEHRRILTPEQINKMKDMSYGYDSQVYGRRPNGR
jgi:Spy/CpxP family protein refolding chaperone